MTRAAAPADVRAAAVPWWVAALAIFAASRVLTTLLFAGVGAIASPGAREGAHPSLLTMATAWDGQWYWWVAVHGYPATLPHGASGAVDTNAWAFLPLYPWLVNWLALGSTADWPSVAVLVSIAFGFGSAVLLAVLLTPRIGRGAALFAVAVFSVSPLAFVLQMAYAESMALCLLLGVLCLIDRHRYAAAVPVTLLLAFTRPGVLALALTVAVHLVLRITATRRGADHLTVASGVAAGALAVVAAAAGFAWPVIAGLVTGVPDAYFATEAAWRSIWQQGTALAWFTPWFDAGRLWAGQWFGTDAAPVAGPVLAVAAIGALALVLLSRPVRRLGSTVWLWCGSYALYLVAVFFPQSSVFRLLMPMAPLAGAVVPRTTSARVAVLTGCAALQALWLWVLLGHAQDWWTVP